MENEVAVTLTLVLFTPVLVPLFIFVVLVIVEVIDSLSNKFSSTKTSVVTKPINPVVYQTTDSKKDLLIVDALKEIDLLINQFQAMKSTLAFKEEELALLKVTSDKYRVLINNYVKSIHNDIKFSKVAITDLVAMKVKLTKADGFFKPEDLTIYYDKLDSWKLFNLNARIENIKNYLNLCE
jgi:predicted PurR-regulated permease PerM